MFALFCPGSAVDPYCCVSVCYFRSSGVSDSSSPQHLYFLIVYLYLLDARGCVAICCRVVLVYSGLLFASRETTVTWSRYSCSTSGSGLGRTGDGSRMRWKGICFAGSLSATQTIRHCRMCPFSDVIAVSSS